MSVANRPHFNLPPYLPQPYIPLPSGGTAYTLTAAAGSFTLTGESATISVQRRLPAAAGSFALTGESAGLSVQRKLTAGAGAFTLTGEPSQLSVQRLLHAASGTFTETGEAASLHVGRVLGAGAGVFTLTGESATLVATGRIAYVLTAGPGAFALTGQSATLTVSTVATGRPIALQWSVGTAIALQWSVGTAIALQWSGTMAVVTNFTFYPGEDILLKFGRAPTDATVITGASLRFQMWLGLTPTGTPVIDSVTDADVVFSITDAANFTCFCPDDDTAPLARGLYWFQLTRTNAGENAVLACGQITLLPFGGQS